MQQRCSIADQCELSKNARTVMVKGRGADRPVVFAVGEAPGRDEDRQGICFVGPSGRKLDEYLGQAGLKDITYINNVTRCCPWSDDKHREIKPPTLKQSRLCAETHLIPEIIQARPKVVVCFGDKAWKFFGTGSLQDQHGRIFNYTIKREDHSAWLSEDLTIAVMPTYHPAHVLRGAVDKERTIQADLQTVRRYLSADEAPRATNYYVFVNPKEFERFVETFVERIVVSGEVSPGFPFLSVDLETEGLDWRDPKKQIVGFGFSWAPGVAAFIPYNGENSPWRDDVLVLEQIRSALRHLFRCVPVMGQNFEYDRRWLWFHLGLEVSHAYDTMSAHKWLYSDIRPHGLDYMAPTYLNIHGHKSDAKEAGAYEETNMGKVDIQTVADLCCADADVTLQLYPYFKSLMEQRGSADHFMLYNMEPMHELFTISQTGMFVNLETLNRQRKHYLKQQEDATQRVRNMKLPGGHTLDAIFYNSYKNKKGEVAKLSITLGSPQRIAFVLFDILRFPPTEKRTTAETPLNVLGRWLDKQIPEQWDGVNPPMAEMERLCTAKEVMEQLFRFRSAQKMVGTYHNNFEKFRMADGCSHSEINICRAVTGRPSSARPNHFNLPHTDGDLIKEIFESRFHGGLIYNGDESQIEVRALAFLSQDPRMMSIFQLDQDMHRFVASNLYGVPEKDITKDQRTRVKKVVFGMFYDRGDEAIAEAEGLEVEFVSKVKETFWNLFSLANNWKAQIKHFAREHGGVLAPQMRWRYLPHIKNELDRKLMGEAEREGINHPVQSVASDVATSGVMHSIRRMRREKFGSLSINQVYDSFTADTYPGDLVDLVRLTQDEFVPQAHKRFPWFNVPFKFEHEIGVNLRDMVEVKPSEKGVVTAWVPGPEKLEALATVVDKWTNLRDMRFETGKEGVRLEIELGPRTIVDRGDAGLNYTDVNYKLSALQPYCAENFRR